MIDQARLDRIALSPRPAGQLLVANLILRPNYGNPLSPTRIVIEGREHLPGGGGAIFVMNHTDRFNYWPFQYQLYREGLGFTATWVKGKYYENPALGWFLDACNNIPIPSRGYVVTKDFQRVIGRVPAAAEYEALRRLIDGEIDEAAARAAGGEPVARLVDAEPLSAESGPWADRLRARFARMMERVVDINRDALARGLFLLIFPEGTRSRRLGRGHLGAAQMILHTGAPVIPVGCNGSDRCYPGDSPLSKGGTIVYRVGEPLTHEGALAPFTIPRPFVPFTPEAERAHQGTFRALTDLLMDRINDLLDPEYRRPDETSGPDGPGGEPSTGARRFV